MRPSDLQIAAHHLGDLLEVPETPKASPRGAAPDFTRRLSVLATLSLKVGFWVLQHGGVLAARLVIRIRGLELRR